MRASLYLIGFAAASLVGAGVVEIGCSSSSSPPAAAENDAASDAPSPAEDSSTPTDGGGGMDAVACTPVGVSSATIDGGASWACFQAACMTQLATCSTDCLCNNAIIQALQCSAPDAAAANSCFTNAINGIIGTDMTNATAIGLCLQQNTGKCGVGGDGGGTTTDGGDGGGPEPSDAGDAGG